MTDITRDLSSLPELRIAGRVNAIDWWFGVIIQPQQFTPHNAQTKSKATYSYSFQADIQDSQPGVTYVRRARVTIEILD